MRTIGFLCVLSVAAAMVWPWDALGREDSRNDAAPAAEHAHPASPDAGTPETEATDREDEAHPVFPTPPRVGTLDNGLKVVTVPWNSPGLIAYYTLVRVGSRDEVKDAHHGLAHLFEHMMFRGTERVPEGEYERKLQSFGADNNAYTTQDYTMYTMTAPAETLPDIVELEADRFQHLDYAEQQYKTETGAVLGEYRKSASSPGLKMWEALSRIAFERHPYGHTTLARLRDIKRMPRHYEDSLRFFERFYTPDNTTIIVAGDAEHARVMELVRTHYGSWEGERARSDVPREPPPDGGDHHHITWEGTSPPRIMIGYRRPGFDGNHEAGEARKKALRDTAALHVARGLAFEESSPLYQRLVVKEQKLVELYAWEPHFTRDPHMVVIEATLKRGTSFDTIRKAIQNELERLASGDVSAERVAAVRSNVRYILPTFVQTPGDAAGVAGTFLAVDDSVRALPEFFGMLEDITPEDVARVAERYLTSDRRFVVTLAPQSAKAEGDPDDDS